MCTTLTSIVLIIATDIYDSEYMELMELMKPVRHMDVHIVCTNGLVY